MKYDFTFSEGQGSHISCFVDIKLHVAVRHINAVTISSNNSALFFSPLLYCNGFIYCYYVDEYLTEIFSPVFFVQTQENGLPWELPSVQLLSP